MKKNLIDENENQGSRVNKRPKWFLWIFLALFFALALASMAGGIVKQLFDSFMSGITPILVALLLAFLMLRPINFIENRMLKNAFVGNPKADKYKRAISLLIVFGVLFALFAVVIVFLLSSIVDMLKNMTEGDNLNSLIQNLKDSLTSIAQTVSGVPAQDIDSALTDAIANISESVSAWFSDLVNNIASYLVDTASIAISMVMSLTITFLLLKDKELISKTSKRMVYAYNSRKNAEEIITITRRTKDMLNEFVVSNLIVMFIIFLIAWVGFTLMGVPMAFLMALILGILAIIPYVGGFIACAPLAIITLMYGDANLMLIAVAFALLDWVIVTTFVPAIVMSKRMNTRAILIVLGLVIGGAMFGVVGMILSAPIMAVISTVWQERLKIREANKEHEELVEAGLVDAQYFGVTEILDLTQDSGYNVPIEQYEDDFKRLQSGKAKIKPVKKREDEIVTKTEKLHKKKALEIIKDKDNSE